MSAYIDTPFNLEILSLTPKQLDYLQPVNVLDTFDGATGNFHDSGLFSVAIFGRVGDEKRQQNYAYIDIKVPVFHPVIFDALVDLKRLYAGIMQGSEFAIWNDEIKDFEKSNPLDGSTGFYFFLKHWEDIQFEESRSVDREEKIKLINTYKKKALTSKIVVMPAGLRDFEVGDDGRNSEDEINEFYRNFLKISNTLTDAAIRTNPEVINRSRWRLQQNFNDLYTHIENMIQGKKKLLLGKWASRRLWNGTRNVISAMDTSVPYLGADGGIGMNSTVIGLYQCMKGMMPVARYLIRNGFLANVFINADTPATLVDPKTLKPVQVELSVRDYDRWATDEGIEKVITAFKDVPSRHQPLTIKGYYVGLIYKGPDGTFRVFQDIDDLPPTRSRDDVHPITFAELLYTSIYRKANTYPVFPTRYPITGVGSIYPSFVYLKTTVIPEVRKEMDEQWKPIGDDYIAYQFPMKDGVFVDSLMPHSSRLARLGADFDGDTCSADIVYSDEAVKEVTDYLKTKAAYIGTDGRYMAPVGVDTVEFVMFNLTGD